MEAVAELSAGAIVYTRYAMHHFTSNFRVEKVGMNFWQFVEYKIFSGSFSKSHKIQKIL